MVLRCRRAGSTALRNFQRGLWRRPWCRGRADYGAGRIPGSGSRNTATDTLRHGPRRVVEISWQMGLAGTTHSVTRIAVGRTGWDAVIRIHERRCNSADRRFRRNLIHVALLEQQAAQGKQGSA